MSDRTVRDRRHVPFAQVEAAVLRDPRITPQCKALYCLLITYGPTNIYPSHDRLAGELGVDRQTIIRWLCKLKEIHLVDWTERVGTSNLYDIYGHADMYVVHGAEADSLVIDEGVSSMLHPVSHPCDTPCNTGDTRSRSTYLDPLKNNSGATAPPEDRAIPEPAHSYAAQVLAPQDKIFEAALTEDTDESVTCPYKDCEVTILLTKLDKTKAQCPNCQANLRIRSSEGRVLFRPRQKARRKETGPVHEGFYGAPVDAFLRLIKVKPEGFSASTRAQWARILHSVGIIRETDAETMALAIDAISTSEHKWRTFASPYEEGFQNVVGIMIAQIKEGKPDPHEDAFAKLRDKPVNL